MKNIIELNSQETIYVSGGNFNAYVGNLLLWSTLAFIMRSLINIKNNIQTCSYVKKLMEKYPFRQSLAIKLETSYFFFTTKEQYFMIDSNGSCSIQSSKDSIPESTLIIYPL